MKTPADIILELESNNSRIFKEDVIIREMNENNIPFFKGIKYACNKLITFGVNEKTTPNKNTETTEIDAVCFDEFLLYLDKFIAREITGNAAKEVLQDICDKTTKNTWNNWYRRILLKDLKCGVSETTINNCAKKIKNIDYVVPVFSCQLAQDSNDHKTKMVGEKIIQVKLDGSRVLTVLYPDGRVDQFSRNGKEIVNFPHIKQQFSIVAKTVDEPTVFDGEIMSASFQDLMTQFYRKENVDTKDSVLNVFDIIPLVDFKKGLCHTPQIDRIKKLDKWFSLVKTSLDNVNVLGYEIINLDLADGKERLSQINKTVLSEGYEGIMIKDLDANYECKRSSNWLKLKPISTIDLCIIGMQEGTDKYRGMLGSLLCSGVDDYKEIVVNVGSGLTDEERRCYWDDKDNVIGKVAEIAYDAITRNLSGEYSLRFPRFLRLRGFERGEKI